MSVNCLNCLIDLWSLQHHHQFLECFLWGFDLNFAGEKKKFCPLIGGVRLLECPLIRELTVLCILGLHVVKEFKVFIMFILIFIFLWSTKKFMLYCLINTVIYVILITFIYIVVFTNLTVFISTVRWKSPDRFYLCGIYATSFPGLLTFLISPTRSCFLKLLSCRAKVLWLLIFLLRSLLKILILCKDERCRNYNAGQKLSRQTWKTASYLTPQVMNNQFKWPTQWGLRHLYYIYRKT